MNKVEAINKYTNYNGYKYIKDYEDADAYCVVHEDDRHLIPIYVPLPQPPEWHLIDGFGLPKEDQVFKRQVYPKKLRDLEKRLDTIEDIWEEIETFQFQYREEVEWIRKQVYHELNGYWFFCNGKPTYLTGHHYIFLNFWNLDKGLPEYRDRGRKKRVFAEYIRGLDNFCGHNYPKGRREGATSDAGEENYMVITKKQMAHSGIQSKTTEHAQMVFQDHIISPWRRLQFFLKPVYDGTDNPKNELNFVPPAKTSTKDAVTGKKGSLIAKNHGLGGSIGFRSSDKYSYDAYRLFFYHGDEVGKTKDVDVNDRFYTIRECLAEGSDIHGECWNTSTVEEMDNEGGENFKRLCDDSQFHDQYENRSGRTKSWLATLFLSSAEGRNGFIGKYGESIIDDPTEEQLVYLKKKYPGRKRYTGALEDILMYRKSYEDSGDLVGLMAYKRKYPIEYRDCWISANYDTGMPIDVIEDRKQELAYILARKNQKEILKGNLLRADQTQQNGTVVFVEDPDGRWELSKILDFKDANKRILKDGVYYPANMDFGMAGGDPFGFNTAKNKSGMSNGGGAVFMYQTAFDRDDIDVSEWDGNRFVCTYNVRPKSKDEYAEDMIMMCQYYGVLMNAEQNKPDLIDYFQSRGYGGYLKYLLNKKTGQFETNPGVFMNDTAKQKIWTRHRDHLRLHGDREMHYGYLEECGKISGTDKMGDFDLFTATGLALLGTDESTFEQIIKGESEIVDIGSFYG